MITLIVSMLIGGCVAIAAIWGILYLARDKDDPLL